MFRSPAIFVMPYLQYFTLGENLKEGDPCRVVRSGVGGACKTLADCPLALSEALAGRIPTQCGWEGSMEIVCCPNSKLPTSISDTRYSARSKCRVLEYFIRYKSDCLFIYIFVDHHS